MDLYWKYLPERLRNLIMERTIESHTYDYSTFKQKFIVDEEVIDIGSLFGWSKTKEGFDFWLKIHRDLSDYQPEQVSAKELKASLSSYDWVMMNTVTLSPIVRESFIEKMNDINVSKTKSKSKFKIETI